LIVQRLRRHTLICTASIAKKAQRADLVLHEKGPC